MCRWISACGYCAKLSERQMRHAPADGSLFEIPRDEQPGFVGIARFLPNALPVWIAPAEHVFDRVESVDHVMRMTGGEAG